MEVVMTDVGEGTVVMKAMSAEDGVEGEDVDAAAQMGAVDETVVVEDNEMEAKKIVEEDAIPHRKMIQMGTDAPLAVLTHETLTIQMKKSEHISCTNNLEALLLHAGASN